QVGRRQRGEFDRRTVATDGRAGNSRGRRGALLRWCPAGHRCWLIGRGWTRAGGRRRPLDRSLRVLSLASRDQQADQRGEQHDADLAAQGPAVALQLDRHRILPGWIAAAWLPL